MGLEVTEDRVVEEQGVRGVLLGLGENEIELLQPTRDDTGVARYLASRGETLHHICFSTDDINTELQRLKDAGVELIDQEPRDGLAGRIAFIHPRAMHGVLIELAQPPAGGHAGTAKGIDHLAVSVKNLDEGEQAWKQVVGLEVTNKIEVPANGMVIGQMPSGQAIVELLAPTSPESPMAARLEEQGESAASMVAIEVPDLDAEVARYRAAGITLDDPRDGVLPNSRTATISNEQAFGLRIQLIEFKR
jgi:methylmalonyl-CoA/ethylmalonyl-CoA epimerase